MPEGNAVSFVDTLRARADHILEACTRCGKCAEACPMIEPAGIDRSDPPALVGGVLDVLAGGSGSPGAVRWTTVCTNSGCCIEACDYGVNPRLMINLARIAAKEQAGDVAVRQAGNRAFNTMGRGVRVISRLLLPPETLARVNPPRLGRERSDGPPDLVFYTGCNVLKTPHIALLCLELLDALGVRYEVMGGPGACCGILQFKAGDAKTAGRVGWSTIDKLGAAGAPQVLSWCPSCQIQIGEVGLPTYADSRGEAPFAFDPFFEYVASRLDDLRPLLRHPVRRRVALKERPALPGVMAAVKRLLDAIPELELVQLDVPRVSTQENHLAVLPDFQARLREQEFRAAADAGVDTLATVYHACHRELCHFEKGVSFEIVNVMELIGEAMGLHAPDLYKRLKLMGDVNAILADTSDQIIAWKLDPDEVREALLVDMGAALR